MDKSEARSNHDDLLKKFGSASKDGGGRDGFVVSESDFHKWNNNCSETARIDE